jgi:hypothetical protein
MSGNLISSSVAIQTDYGLDDRMIGVQFPVGAGNFSLRHSVQTSSEAHTASYPMGTGGSFLGGKAAGRGADHSSPSSAEVKQCVFMAWYLVKHMENFTFAFTRSGSVY